MRNINEVANWYKNNNILAASEELRLKILCLYTKAAFTITGKQLKCTEISFNDKSFNIGITNTDTKATFTKEELQIMHTINHCYGYDKLRFLLWDLSHVQNCTIENITGYLKKRLLEDIEGYQYYDFDEYVLLLGENVFFVNNNTTLTDEEKSRLEKHEFPNQDSFIVFRDTNGKLVVY